MRSSFAASRISPPAPVDVAERALPPVARPARRLVPSCLRVCPADRHYTAPPMRGRHTIVVLEGDQTGQELLEEAPAGARAGRDRRRARLLRFDLSLENRRGDGERGRPRGGCRDPRARPRAEGGDRDAGDARRRRLAEPDPPRGDRRQGDRPHGPPDPGVFADRRRARADLDRAHGRRRRLRRDGVARRRGRRRGRVPHGADRAARSAMRSPSSRSARRSGAAPRSSAGRSTR